MEKRETKAAMNRRTPKRKTSPPSRMQLDNVLVVQHVVARDGLAVEHAGAPHLRLLERVQKVAMHEAGQFQHRAADRAGKRRLHVGRLARLLRVDADHAEEAEDRLAQL